ncbi:MAG: carboxylating nicotinate-nucleotide diphosphorylase [Fuerstiella sp.]
MNSIEYSSQLISSAESVIQMALDEDLAERCDITSAATVPQATEATVNIVARETGRLAGIVLLPLVYRILCERDSIPADAVSIDLKMADGDLLAPGDVVASVSGPVRLLLTGERTILNFLIHLSGIASLTHQFVHAIEGSKAVILDTRKTLPGYRLLHKYAVRCGGGTNHRMGLYDGMLIKDNHLAARGNSSVSDAVTDARTWLAQNNLAVPVELEVDTLEQLRTCLTAQPEIVLLDNMTNDQMREAIEIRNEHAPNTLLEASGGVNLTTVAGIAATGVDRISIGALTHSAKSLDLGFDWPW